MNRWLLLGMLVTAGAGLGDADDAGGPGSRPTWLSSYAEAQAAAAQTGKPIFAVFR